MREPSGAEEGTAQGKYIIRHWVTKDLMLYGVIFGTRKKKKHIVNVSANCRCRMLDDKTNTAGLTKYAYVGMTHIFNSIRFGKIYHSEIEQRATAQQSF